MHRNSKKTVEVSLTKRIVAVIMMVSYIFVLCPVTLFAESTNKNTEIKRMTSVKEEKSEVLISAEEGGIVTLGDASIEIPEGALKKDTKISITRLLKVEDTGESLYNAIPHSGGYRFLPAGTKFEKDVTITLPYSSQLNAKPQSLDELYTYFYDTQKKSWIKLERLEVDRENHKVRSLSTHFTDMINATLTMPESASPVDVNLNSIKNLEAAKPDSHLIKFNPPKASNMGDASFSFELAVPAGRKGMQPQISVSYSSGGGNGIMGKGFDVSYGSCITIDTRFGLPKYDGIEQSRSEEYVGNMKVIPTNYMLDGILLYEKNRDTKDVYYIPQKETYFSRIKRVLSDNHWEVTDKNGTTRFYDQSINSCVGSGNETFTWNVTKSVDVNGNNIVYKYIKDEGYVYPDEICYTGNENKKEEGKYFVKFIYNRNNSGEENSIQRKDIRIDARSKHIIACKKLLTSISTHYGSITDNNAIRKYSFLYKEGLAKEKQLTTFTVSNNANENYAYSFDYIEPEKNGSEIKYFADAAQWNNGQPLQTGNSTNIGANFNAGAGVGYGFEVVDVRVSGGADGAVSGGNNFTEDTIVDINGDGMPDAIFQEGNVIKVYLNLGKDLGFSSEAKTLSLNSSISHDIDNESVNSSSFGWNVYSGIGSKADTVKIGAGYSEVYQNSNSTLHCSFIDIDRDGLVDIVESGKTTYLKNMGKLVFEERTLYSEGNVIISDVIQKIDDKEKNKYRKTYFVQSPFRMWKAPLEGIATITETINGIEGIYVPEKSVIAKTFVEIDNNFTNDKDLEVTISSTEPVTKSKNNYVLDKNQKFYFISDAGEEPKNSDIKWNIEIDYKKVKGLKQGWPLPIIVPEKLPQSYYKMTEDTSDQSLEDFKNSVVNEFKNNFTDSSLIIAYNITSGEISATQEEPAKYYVSINLDADWIKKEKSALIYGALINEGLFIPAAFTEEEFKAYLNELKEKNLASKFALDIEYENREAEFYKNFASKFEYSITEKMFFLKDFPIDNAEGSKEKKDFYDTYPLSIELKQKCLDKFNIRGINKYFSNNNIKYNTSGLDSVEEERKRSPSNAGTIFEKEGKVLYHLGFFARENEKIPVYYNETDKVIECNNTLMDRLKVQNFQKNSDSANITLVYNKDSNEIHESLIKFNLEGISYKPLNISCDEFKKIYDDIVIDHINVHDSYWDLKNGEIVKEDELLSRFEEMEFTEDEQEKLISALYGEKKEKLKKTTVHDYFYYTMLEEPDYATVEAFLNNSGDIEYFKIADNDILKEEEVKKLFKKFNFSEETGNAVIAALYGDKKEKTKEVEVLDYYYYSMLENPDYETEQTNLDSFDIKSYKRRIVEEKIYPFYEKEGNDYLLKEFWKTEKSQSEIFSLYQATAEKEAENEVVKENKNNTDITDDELEILINQRIEQKLNEKYKEYKYLSETLIDKSKKFNLGKFSTISCNIDYNIEHLYEVYCPGTNSAYFSILTLQPNENNIRLTVITNPIKKVSWNSYEDFNSENINKEFEIYNYEQKINLSDFLTENELKNLDSTEEIQQSQITVSNDEFLYGGINSWYYGIWKGAYTDIAFSQNNLNSYKSFIKTETENKDALIEEQKKKSDDKKKEIKDAEETRQTDGDSSVVQEDGKTNFYLPYTLSDAVLPDTGITDLNVIKKVKDYDKFLCGTISTYSELKNGMYINSYYMPYIDGDIIHADRAGGISYYKIEGLYVEEKNNTSQSNFVGTKEFLMPSIRRTFTTGTDRTPKADIGIKVASSVNNLWEQLKDIGGASGSRGWNKSESNVKQSLQDINGDGIPDILQITDNGINITYGEIQNDMVVYTSSQSNYSASSISKNDTDVNVYGGSVSPSGNVSIRLKGTKQAFPVQEPKPNATAGFTTTNGSNIQSAGLIDLNGDGLPDYYDGSSLSINNGRSFGSYSISSWNNFGAMTESSNASVGANFSVGKSYGGEDVNSLQSGGGFSVGGSYSASTSNTKKMLMDINGDGLQDILYMNAGGTSITVSYNTGNAFEKGENIELQSWGTEVENNLTRFTNGSDNTGFSLGPVDDIPLIGPVTRTALQSTVVNPYGFNAKQYANSLEWNTSLTLGISGSLGGNVNIPIKVFIPTPVPVWVGSFDITANAGAGVNLSTSVNGVSVRMMDLDGDGLADHVLRIPGIVGLAGVTYWKRNISGKYGLLKQVNLPQGGSVQIEYEGLYGTEDNPNFKYVMSKVTMNDGVGENDVLPYIKHGAHCVTTSFEYNKAYYDRSKKEFYGFETVKTINADRTYTVDTYYNKDYYLKGCVEKSETRTVDGAILSKNATEYCDSPVSLPAKEEAWTYEKSSGNSEFIHTETEYKYDEFGNCIEIKQNFGDGEILLGKVIYDNTNTTDYIIGLPVDIRVYDSNGNLLRHRSGDYDDLGQLKELRQYFDAYNYSVHTLKYDSYGNIKSVADSRGATLAYTYDKDENMFVTGISQSGMGTDSYESKIDYDVPTQTKKSEADCNGNKLSYEYDSWQRIKEIRTAYDTDTTPAVSYEYNTPNNDSFGHHELWYAVTNNKVTFDADDDSIIQTVLQIDGLGRAVRTAKTGFVNGVEGWNASGAVEYDSKGRTVKEGMTEFIQGDIQTLLESVPKMTALYTAYEYDEKDRQIKTILPDGFIQFAEFEIKDGKSVSYSIDPLGNVSIRETDSRGNIVRVAKNDKDGKQLTEVTYRYNAMGEMLKAFDAKGYPITVEYDLLGRRTALESLDSGRQEFFYDECSNLVRENNSVLRENNKQIVYEYDDLNRLIKIDYPDTEDTVYTYGGANDTHGAAGKILSVTDASGTLEYEYGKLGEVTKETRTLATHLNGERQTETAVMEYRSDYLGRMQWIVYPDGEKVTYGYDNGGQVVSVTGEHYGHEFNYVTNILYDEYGQRTRIDYGNGTFTEYNYDPARRWLDTIKTENKWGQSYQNISYSFDAVGNVLGYENDCLSSVTGNYKTKQTYSYDNLYQLVKVDGETTYNPYHSTAPEFKSNYSQTFTFDDIGLGNMTSKVSAETVSPQKSIGDNLNYSFNYVYDENYAHRLINAGDRYYKYDANGNIICEQDGSFESDGDDGTYHKITQETDDVYSTDYGWGLFKEEDGSGDGVKTSRYCRTYTWNEKNQLISSVDSNYNTAYVYGQDGQRVNKYTQNSETLYFNKMWTLHTDSGNNVYGGQTSKNIYLGETRIVTKLNSGDEPTYNEEYYKQYYYHSDHLGSANLISDYKGDEYQRIEYTPYGETWVEKTQNTGLEYLPYKFTGKEIDEETGLYYYGARYLDPKYNHWMSTDPALGDYVSKDFKGEGGVYNPVNLNLYHYGNNNPVKYTDPDGEAAHIVVGAVIGAVIGGVSAACSGASARQIAAAAVGGAVTGGLAAATCGASLGMQIAGSAMAGTAGYCAEKLVAGERGTVEGMVQAAAGGAAGAMVGAVISKAVACATAVKIAKSASSTESVGIKMSRSKYPESVKHIEDAIKNGQPEELTLDRSGAKANRRASLKGHQKIPNLDLDEYPPAMSKEGGFGADIRGINRSDNRGSGSSAGHQLRNYPDGTKFHYKITD